MDRILGGDLSDRRGDTFSTRSAPLVAASVDTENVYEAVTVCGRNEGEGCGKER